MTRLVVHREFKINDVGFRDRDDVTVYEEIDFSVDDLIINCVGYKDLSARVKVGQDLRDCPARLTTFISSRAIVYPGVEVGLGSVLLGDVVIERGCAIGDHCLLWGGARVCHDATLGQGVFLAAGSIVGGFAVVGDCCALGFNAVVRDSARLPPGTRLKALNYFGSGGARGGAR